MNYVRKDSTHVCLPPPHVVVSQIVFPQPGALGLNLRSYFVQKPAGARLGLPEYGSLVVVDSQNAWLKASTSVDPIALAWRGAVQVDVRRTAPEARYFCSTFDQFD